MNRFSGCLVRIAGVTVILALLGTAAVFIAYRSYQKELHTPADPPGIPQTFVVMDGWSLYRTAMELENTGLIRDQRILKVYSRLASDPVVIKAGEYLISPAESPVEILDKLVSGKVITYSITFPEGLTVAEMASRWETAGYGRQDAFLDAVRQYRHPRMDYPDTGWEGYLFPDTYLFSKPFSDVRVIDMMVNRLEQILKPEWLASAAEHSLDRHQVMTLASLIERETRVEYERGLVSSVFHNRLGKGMLLQCDPTVIYAMGDQYQGILLRKHLSLDSPYNTYVYPGLPPGPIGAPGKTSIEAACFPPDSPYLYFVANSEGGHAFSRTLTEHNRAVRRYREWLRLQQHAGR